MATFRSDLRIDPPLKELRTALKELDKSLPKALNKVTKEGAEIVASDARAKASGMGRQQQRAVGQIKASGTAQGAVVRLAASAGVPYAMAALLGMTRRTGWFANPKYGRYITPGGSGGQHLPWIGTGWNVGDLTAGPRAINPAFAAKAPALMEFLERELTALASKHFPNP